MDAVRLGIIKVNLNGEQTEVDPNGDTEAGKVKWIKMTKLEVVREDSPGSTRTHKR